jgi:hypothetical protein
MAEIFKINDIDYSCEFKLKNSDGKELNLTKSAIKGMSLVYDFFDPFTSGTVSIANPYDLLEHNLLFNGDGGDEFKFEIFPKERPREKITEEFILIEEANDVNPTVRSENIRTYSLVDKKSLPFMEKVPYNKAFTGKTGKILKEIFKELLGEDMIGDEWEDGDFSMTYMPPIYHRYMDVVNYMIRHYYVKDGDVYIKAFINFEDGKFTMKKLSKLFEKNKDNTIEAFILGDLTGKTRTDNPSNPPPDAEVGEYFGALKNIAYSTPLYNWNSEITLNSLVHGYDPMLGVHNIRKLTLKDVKDRWEKKFVKPFSYVGGAGEPFVMTNKETNQKFKHYRMAYPIEDTVKLVEAEMCNVLTFYNMQCSFSNMGSTIRNCGKFVDVVKTSEIKSDSDRKLLGRWFVTKVRHNFLADTYTNDIFCCKTHIGPKK